jgi:hypothetical protein
MLELFDAMYLALKDHCGGKEQSDRKVTYKYEILQRFQRKK